MHRKSVQLLMTSAHTSQAAQVPEAPQASGVSALPSACGGRPWQGLPCAPAPELLLLLPPTLTMCTLSNSC